MAIQGSGGGSGGEGGGSKGILASINEALRNLFGVSVDLNEVLSGLTPEIRSSATSWGKAAKRFVGKNSAFRSKLAERGYGIVTARIQKLGKGKESEAIFEKLSDWLDHFFNEFLGEGDGAPSEAVKSALAPARAKFYARRFERDAKRLESASDTDAKDVAKRLQGEHEALARNWKIAEEGLKEPEKPAVPMSERLEDFNETLEKQFRPVATRLQQKAAALKAGNTALKAALDVRPKPSETWADKLWKWIFGA